MKYVLDSNILIGISLDDESIYKFLNSEVGAQFFVSVITITEVLWHKNMKKEEMEYLELAISLCKIIPVDEKLARDAIKIRMDTTLKTADSLIVASAMYVGATILTRDKDILREAKNISIEI